MRTAVAPSNVCNYEFMHSVALIMIMVAAGCSLLLLLFLKYLLEI